MKSQILINKRFFHFKMKLFVFTDTHGNKKLISALIKKIQISNPDIVVCAGDLTNFSKNLDKLLNMFKKTNLPLLIIPGNHETNSGLEKACKKTKFAVNIHKRIYSINNYLFFGFGLGGFAEKNLELERLIPEIKKVVVKKILIAVTHQPPYRTRLDLINSVHSGSRSIRKLVKEAKPKLNICGHLHENENKIDKINSTLIINPGHKGKIIKI